MLPRSGLLSTLINFSPPVHGLQRCQSVAGRAVRQFNGRKEDVRMPCKYHAVRQQCGDYAIFLTPGNRYMYPKYRLDSLWFKVANASDPGQYWRGRTDNKLARKVGHETCPLFRIAVRIDRTAIGTIFN